MFETSISLLSVFFRFVASEFGIEDEIKHVEGVLPCLYTVLKVVSQLSVCVSRVERAKM